MTRTRTALYRRGHQRRSFIVTRANRLAAVTTNLARGLALLAAALIPWWYSATEAATPTWAAIAAAVTVPTAWKHIRSLRTAVQGWGGRKNPGGIPGPVRAAVEDLAGTYGLKRRRIAFLVHPPRSRMHAPLAAMSSGFDGAVLMIDTNLAAKAESARPGDQIDNEVRAIVAHELAHWYAWDSLTATLGAAANVLALGGGALAAVLAYTGELPTGAAAFAAWPALTYLATRFVSRQAEHRADARAANVTGTPDALASALVRDFGMSERTWKTITSTHPPTADRVRRLIE